MNTLVEIADAYRHLKSHLNEMFSEGHIPEETHETLIQELKMVTNRAVD